MHRDLLFKYFTLVLCVACSSACSRAHAQAYFSSPVLDDADLSMEWMKLNLSLTREDADVIGVINVRYAVRFDSIRRSNEDRFVKVSKTRNVKQQRDDEFKLILSEEQYKIYRAEQLRRSSVVVNPFE
jgi:hypothetical protein